MKGQDTKDRKEMYEAALEKLTDPEKLRKLADSFDHEGFPIRAVMLRKRADLRSAPPEVKAIRKAAYEKGMQSRNVAAIRRLADEFEKLTATGSASELRKHADEVEIEERLSVMNAVKGEATTDSPIANEMASSEPKTEPEPKTDETRKVPMAKAARRRAVSVHTQANGTVVEVRTEDGKTEETQTQE